MRKIFSLILLVILFFQITSFVFAQGVPPSPKEDPAMAAMVAEDARLFEREEMKRSVFVVVLWVEAIISLILSYFISRKMVRKNSKITNLVIHIIISLASIVLFIMTIVQTVECLGRLNCTTAPIKYITYFTSLTTIISTIFSLFIIKDLIKNKKENEYRINLSSSVFFSWIIFSVISMISEIIIQPKFDLLLSLILLLLTVPVTLALYVFLVITGYFIDKSGKKNS